jgi:hypothetical protein
VVIEEAGNIHRPPLFLCDFVGGRGVDDVKRRLNKRITRLLSGVGLWSLFILSPTASYYYECMDEAKIRDLPHFLSLWQDIYASAGKPAWDHILPYYDKDILFQDSVQEIRGIKKFSEMTRRLAKRSKNLEFLIRHSVMGGDLIFIEWEMMISYKNYPTSSVFGASRILLREGKILEQRDYYDLWGDIFDNIPFLRKAYRLFMRKRFG